MYVLQPCRADRCELPGRRSWMEAGDAWIIDEAPVHAGDDDGHALWLQDGPIRRCWAHLLSVVDDGG